MKSEVCWFGGWKGQRWEAISDHDLTVMARYWFSCSRYASVKLEAIRAELKNVCAERGLKIED